MFQSKHGLLLSLSMFCFLLGSYVGNGYVGDGMANGGCIQQKPAKQEDDKPKLKTNDDPLAHVEKTGDPNPLINETSPYLLMHAYNPVQWRPWNQETLALAKKEGKPIFLSIGYSSCHWCHVMERESFMDKEIAKILNEKFICVKVDREERPDVDSIYMTALGVYNRVSKNGGGTGWPLSMFLTPEAKPFFGGTYFPARDGDRGARAGFLTIIQRVHDVYTSKTERVNQDADFLIDLVKKELDGTRASTEFKLDKSVVDQTVQSFSQVFDSEWGGFGFSPANPRIPKFPQATNLFAMLDAAERWNNDSAKNMLTVSLEKMYLGGMYDHLGGGFHRYSVDRYWRIPHFEKMLYDNGQLASVYARASKFLDRSDFAEVAKGICDFVTNEMTHPDGGFYSALDAETDGEEGKYYVWSRDEIKKIVGADQYAEFASVYQIDKAPNFEDKAYAPQLEKRLDQWALEKSISRNELDARLNRSRNALLSVRAERARPLTDTKILTGWNGLMIRGMADTGRILNEPQYIATAERAADFVISKLRNQEGRLFRSYRGDQAKLNAYLDDYAFLIDGLIALHEASLQKNSSQNSSSKEPSNAKNDSRSSKWLDLAIELQKKQDELFWDKEGGGYFFTSGDHESLLARSKNPADNARPSGNSVSALNLIYLSQATGNKEYLAKANKIVETFAGILDGYPRAVPLLAVVASKLIANQKSEKSP